MTAAVLAVYWLACYTGGLAQSYAMERYRRAHQAGKETGEPERDRPLLEAALAYAGEGWPVLPVHHPIAGGCSCGRPACSSPGKHPLTRNGLKAATTEAERIRSWWGQHPQANIGIATGKLQAAGRPGLVVLDVDPRHGGDASLNLLCRRHGQLPYTRMVYTGGGGRHYYFRTQEDLKCTVRLEGLPGLDVRANGGYVIAPPSRHISGILYRFARPQVPVAEVPEWLAHELLPITARHLIERPHPQSRGERLPSSEACLRQALEQATPGNRNITGFMLACRLRDLGIEAWEAEAILRNYASEVPQGEPPYTVYEALASVRQAYKRLHS